MPFGRESAAATEDQAVDHRLRWLEWQDEHAPALDSLQQAERVYHRTMTGIPFPTGQESSPREQRDQVVAALESAGGRLDAIRSRRPE